MSAEVSVADVNDNREANQHRTIPEEFLKQNQSKQYGFSLISHCRIRNKFYSSFPF
jgi:hypothetical protein